MAYPVAAGSPGYSRITIPEIWSSKLLVKYYDSSVMASISTRMYEGEIRQKGEVVKIRTTPNVTIRPHVDGQKLIYENLVPDVIDLPIDKGNYWGWISKDVAKKQSDSTYMEGWTEAAAKDLQVAIETPILQSFYADAHVKNQGATAGIKSGNVNLGVTGAPVALDKTNIVDVITQMEQVLSEQNALSNNMGWIVLPPWAIQRIKTSDLKDASMTGDGVSILRRRDGRVGMIGCFEVFVSNLLSQVTDGANTPTHIPFGNMDGLTFATQLTENEGPMRSTDFFGNLYRGLQVYGWKVLKPEAIGHLYARPA